MSAERFTLDTNILVYSIDDQAGMRQAVAQFIIEQARHRDCCLTLQAVSEFFAAATRKGKMPAPEAAAQAQDWLEMFPCLPQSSSAVRFALAAAIGHRASYWDALLVATAADGGCTTILTEDLADGSILGGLRVVNPFGSDGLSNGARGLLLLQ